VEAPAAACAASEAAASEAAALRRQVAELKAARAAAEGAATALREELHCVSEELEASKREGRSSPLQLKARAASTAAAVENSLNSSGGSSSGSLGESSGGSNSEGGSLCNSPKVGGETGEAATGEAVVRLENEALRLRLTEVEGQHAELVERTEAQRAAAAATAE
jgi:hypothetical protein